jgi:hypothetical protein
VDRRDLADKDSRQIMHNVTGFFGVLVECVARGKTSTAEATEGPRSSVRPRRKTAARGHPRRRPGCHAGYVSDAEILAIIDALNK